MQTYPPPAMFNIYVRTAIHMYTNINMSHFIYFASNFIINFQEYIDKSEMPMRIT